jgi:ABC-type nitrate/sulfonate/bicarbonate transport system substrate-binding protein
LSKGRYSRKKAGRDAARVALCAILLLACRPALADEPLSVARDRKTPPLMNALNLIAEGAGFYADERLKVSSILTDSPLEALRLCASGQADICPVGIEPLVLRYDEGIRMKLFLARASKFGYVIGVPEGSPIKTLSDFKGKKIGVHATTGTSAVFTTESALAAAGLKPGDYELVTIGMDDQAVGALASGQVVAAALPFYELIPFMVAGTKLRILRHPSLGDVANAGYAAAPSVMAAKGDALKHFSRAIVKASLLVRYHPAAAARALLTADGKPFGDADLARKTAELTFWEDDLPAADPDNKRIGAISMAGMQAYIQLLADAGVTKTAIPAAQVVSDQFIEFANDFDHKSVDKYVKPTASR